MTSGGFGDRLAARRVVKPVDRADEVVEGSAEESRRRIGGGDLLAESAAVIDDRNAAGSHRFGTGAAERLGERRVMVA